MWCDKVGVVRGVFVCVTHVLHHQVHIPEEQGHAHIYLARYNLKRKNFPEAEAHAHKCGEFPDVSDP